MALRNEFGAIALDSTLQEVKDLLTQIENNSDLVEPKLDGVREDLSQLLTELQSQQKNSLTNIELRAQDIDTADSGEREYTHKSIDVTAAGDTPLIVPAAGKRVRIRWIYAINDPTASTPCKIKIRFGSNQPIYNVWAISKRQKKTGAVDETLFINLSTTADIAVTVIYEEI